mmetsp:Transcript_58925/g.108862  ORF Transcript_58925/g.108862 Transcript_58925/m.108862 type:complete len:327 (-) Transcript_58925:158-1138(-)
MQWCIILLPRPRFLDRFRCSSPRRRAATSPLRTSRPNASPSMDGAEYVFRIQSSEKVPGNKFSIKCGRLSKTLENSSKMTKSLTELRCSTVSSYNRFASCSDSSSSNVTSAAKAWRPRVMSFTLMLTYMSKISSCVKQLSSSASKMRNSVFNFGNLPSLHIRTNAVAMSVVWTAPRFLLSTLSKMTSRKGSNTPFSRAHCCRHKRLKSARSMTSWAAEFPPRAAAVESMEFCLMSSHNFTKNSKLSLSKKREGFCASVASRLEPRHMSDAFPGSLLWADGESKPSSPSTDWLAVRTSCADFRQSSSACWELAAERGRRRLKLCSLP